MYRNEGEVRWCVRMEDLTTIASKLALTKEHSAVFGVRPGEGSFNDSTLHPRKAVKCHSCVRYDLLPICSVGHLVAIRVQARIDCQFQFETLLQFCPTPVAPGGTRPNPLNPNSILINDLAKATHFLVDTRVPLTS
jgi:hypothetical protein